MDRQLSIKKRTIKIREQYDNDRSWQKCHIFALTNSAARLPCFIIYQAEKRPARCYLIFVLHVHMTFETVGVT